LVISTQGSIIASQNGTHKPKLQENTLYQTTQYDHSEGGSVDQLSHHCDGILLTPHSDAVLNNWDDQFLDLMDLWCSLVVNKQVNVEQLYGKPLIVMDNNRKFSYKDAFNGDIDWDDPKVERKFLDFIGK